MDYLRPQASVLAARIAEPRRFIQVVSGARQVGKSTLVQAVIARSRVPTHYVSADDPASRSVAWLEQQWEVARSLADRAGAILVVDEVQKLPHWSETVKALWDADTRARRRLQVVLLGSAPRLMQSGLSESLAGRFERIYLPHWSWPEMRAAFDMSLDDYVFYGGYPGAAALVGQPERWSRYILDSLIETTLSRDVLLLNRVEKPVLLRHLFQLGCEYSGQILSYNKMLGQLQDAGNTTTLAHYLGLLAGAGMLTGLPKYSGRVTRQRGSSPKLQVLNSALHSAQSGYTFETVRRSPELWGRWVESAVGAHLANAAQAGAGELTYWRDRDREMDFVFRAARRVLAIEVKCGRARLNLAGASAFAADHKPDRVLLVGGDGIPLETFLSRPVEHWLGPR